LIAQPARKAPGRAVRNVAKIRMLDSEKAIELEGTIMTVLPGTMFRVALANDHLVLAHVSGKMRKRFIRLTIGDRVKMEMSPYDTAKARIVYRL
jgi:translation initiation factor IF-1